MLHQDDYVLLGFYDLLHEGTEESDAGAILAQCRHFFTLYL